MCGIAGVINKKKNVNVGEQMSLMLQGIKHRGPDSTGYAMYGKPKKDGFILRFKVSENVAEQSLLSYILRYFKTKNKAIFFGFTIHGITS